MFLFPMRVLGLLGAFTVYSMKQFNNPTLNSQFNGKDVWRNIFDFVLVPCTPPVSILYTPTHCLLLLQSF